MNFELIAKQCIETLDFDNCSLLTIHYNLKFFFIKQKLNLSLILIIIFIIKYFNTLFLSYINYFNFNYPILNEYKLTK